MLLLGCLGIAITMIGFEFIRVVILPTLFCCCVQREWKNERFLGKIANWFGLDNDDENRFRYEHVCLIQHNDPFGRKEVVKFNDDD